MQKSDRPLPVLFRLPFQTAPVLGFLLLAVDFTTKAIAVATLPLDRRLPTFLPFLHWRLTYNTGSHYLFGSIGERIPYRWTMGVAAILVCGLVVLLAREGHRMRPSRWRAVQWLMVGFLIGALGNALEVVVLGRATDFFMLDPFPWPANLADQWVNATIFVLLPLSLWFSWKEESASPPPEPDLSVIITAFRERSTIGAAIEGFLPQLPENAELLVVCPDPETSAVVANYDNPEEILGMLPHQIMHACGLGVRDLALGSNMLWDCLTCYQCQEHCPQGVCITDVLYELKNVAVKQVREKIPGEMGISL
jgi:lipoprotein signal peptidase